MNKKLIFYGDSNTYGYDPRDFFEGRYPEDKCWTGIIRERTNFRVESHGMCGRCIPRGRQTELVVRQIQGWISSAGPAELFVMLGTNDILQDEGLSAYGAAARIGEFMFSLLSSGMFEGDDRGLCLISPPVMERGEWTDGHVLRESRRFDEAYGQTAKRLGIDFIGTGEWEIPVIYDGVHFSEEGHRVFAEKMLSEIRKRY